MKKNSFIKVILSTLVILIGGFICEYTINLDNFPEIFYLDKTKVNIENLMFSMWQAQVTLSLISITLTSLILDRLEERYYGFKIKDILVLKKRFSLNYIEKIFIVILLAIINLCFIIYSKLCILMWIFIINAIIILWLIYDTINILINTNIYDKWIKEYITSIINDGSDDEFKNIIDNIKYHNEEILKLGNTIILRNNMSFLLSQLNSFSENNYSYNKKHRISYIEDCYTISSSLILESNCIDLYTKNLDKIIDRKFKYIERKSLIYELLGKLINKTRDNNTEKICKKIFDYFLDNIIENIDENEIKVSYISSCLFNCFYAIYKNNAFNLYDKENTIEEYIKRIIPICYSSNVSKEYFIKKLAIYYIVKQLVSNKDISTFNKIINQIYNKNALSLNIDNDNQIYEIITTINIYIYYIVCVEDLYKDDYKNIVKEFLTSKVEDGTKDTKSVKTLLEMQDQYIWNYYKVIKEEMPKSDWVYKPNDRCKILVIEKSIDEFYLFYTIVFIEAYKYNDIIEQNINIERIVGILEYFDNNGEFICKVNERFEKFKSIYAKNDENIDKNRNEFYLLLNRYYVKLIIKRECEYNQNKLVTKNKEKIKEQIMLKLQENKLYNIVERLDYIEDEYTLGIIPISTSVLAEEVSLLGETYEQGIVYSIENKILDILTENIDRFEYTYNDSDKITNALAYYEDKAFVIDSVINNLLSDSWYIQYEESNEDIDKLKKLETSIKNKYRLGKGNRVTILFEKKYMNIDLEITKLEIRDVSEKHANDLLPSIQTQDKYYKKRVVNNIELLFTKEEMIKYLMLKDKELEIRFKVFFDKEKFKGAIYKIKT